MNRIIGLALVLSAAACGAAEPRARDSVSSSPMKHDRYANDERTVPTVATSDTVARDNPNTNRNVSPAMASPAPNPPATSTDETTPMPDTRSNDRDRHNAVTPTDQGSSTTETAITARIRKAVMGDSLLSFTAKSVKIITVGTKVTLRGPVNSIQERTLIERHAKQTQGVTEVDNQLQVKKK